MNRHPSDQCGDEIRYSGFCSHMEQAREEGVEDFDLDDYGVREREFTTGFEVFHKPTGTVLLFSTFVSLSTLVRVAGEHNANMRARSKN